MALFRDLLYAQYQSPYAGLPVNEVNALGSKLEEQYLQNQDAADLLQQKLREMKVRDPNRPLLEEKIGEVGNTIAQINERGDWENARGLLRNTANRFANDPLVRGALDDQKKYDEWEAMMKERLGRGVISQSQYDNAIGLASATNTNAVTYDENTRKYGNMFDAYSPVEQQNIGKDMMILVQDWKANKRDIQFKDAKGGTVNYRYTPRGYINVQTETYVDEKEVAGALRQVIAGDRRYKDYLEEEVRFEMFNSGLGLKNGGKAVTVDDFTKVGITPEEFETYVEKNGWDYDALVNDPEVLEGIFMELGVAGKIDNYIKPAAEKAGFSQIENQFLTDHILMAGIEHSNRMKEINAQKKAQEFEKPDLSPITISNPGALIPGKAFDSKAASEAAAQTRSELAKVERALSTHNTNKPQGNYSELKQQQAELKSRLAAQTVTTRATATEFLGTDKGKKALDRAYGYYKSTVGNATPMSKERFAEEMKNVYSPTEFPQRQAAKAGFKNAALGLINPVASLIGAVSDMVNGANNKDPKQTERAAFWESYQMFHKGTNAAFTPQGNSVNQFVKKNESIGFGSEFGNVLTGEDLGQKSPYVYRMNEALTNRVVGNRTDYLVAGGVQLDAYINQYAKKEGKDPAKISIKVAMTDMDGGDGSYPHYITLIDKDTKETIHQTYLFPKSGGGQERYNTGIAMMQENQPGSANYRIGNYMAASAMLPELSKTKIAPQLSAITDNSPASAPPVYTQPVNINGQTFRVGKMRRQYFDDEGKPVGTNTVYRLELLDEKGKPIDALPNPAMAAAGATGDAAFDYSSLDDIQVGMFSVLQQRK